MTNNTNLSPRKSAILKAREKVAIHPIYLDTETTGLKSTDEIIEISVIDDDGKVVYESLVRPTQPISPDAMAVHGITNQDVQKAPPWPVIWPTLRTYLFCCEIGIYNAEFDIRMMQQSHARYRLPWKENLKSFDIMNLYALYKGEWDNVRRSYRYHSLAKAGKECQIDIPNAHRAATDTLLARALLHFMADSDPG
jgi:DNA polymerase III subunit epsilon